VADRKLDPVTLDKNKGEILSDIPTKHSCIDKKSRHKIIDFGYPDPLLYKNCIHNQTRALEYRYLKETPQFKPDFKVLQNCVDEFIAELKGFGSCDPLTVKQFLESYTGPLRTRYERAVKNAYIKGVKHDINVFVKDEFYRDLDKNPRNIFQRSYAFNVLYGRYTKPLEHLLMKHPWVAKGKNFLQRGQQFSDMVLKCRNIFENDFSAFEGSQRSELLKFVELPIFKAMFPDHHGEIDELFEAKLQKKMHTFAGLKAYVYGLRGSGDMDTGLGNTIVNIISIKYAYSKSKVTGTAQVDGDDSVLFTSGEVLSKYFEQLGLVCKMVKRDSPDEVEFCSGRYVNYYASRYIYIQDIDKLLVSLQCYKQSTQYNFQSYYYTLGLMYSKIYGRLPFFNQLSTELLKFRQFKNCNFIKSLHNINRFGENLNNDFPINEALFVSKLRQYYPKLTYEMSVNLDYQSITRKPTRDRYIVFYQSKYENIRIL